MANKVSISFNPNVPAIKAKIKSGEQSMTIAVTEAVIQYGNDYVKVDQGTLRDSALEASIPKKGLAIWDTPYAKKQYYTGKPSKKPNSLASLMWADKGVKTHKKDLDKIAQNAFNKGIGG